MAAATARQQIPVVNNVITDEDMDNVRTEGKVRKYLLQRSYLIGNHREITCNISTAFWQTCSRQCTQNTQTTHGQTLGESLNSILWIYDQ